MRAEITREVDLSIIAEDWQVLGEEASSQSAPSRRSSPSQATQLVNLATRRCQLYHTPQNQSFARIDIEKHVESYEIRSKGFKEWLRREYFAKERKAPSGQAMEECIVMMEAKANYEGRESEMYLRIGQSEGCLYVDLCDAGWRVVEISSAGWRILDHSPVAFRRAYGMLALPAPTQGDLQAFRPLLNLASDDDWIICASWLIGSIRAAGPYPILAIHGEPGSAKSTSTKMLRQLVDPSVLMVRAMFREERDLAIAARNGWILAWDNVSKLVDWQSDALCRIATGSGFGTRKLHSDDEEVLFDAARPMLLNGIESLAERADLADRTLVLELPVIPESRRRLESGLWHEYRRLWPMILGGVFDGVTTALRNYAQVILPGVPRMADFAVWSMAAEQALGCRSGEFMRAYAGNRQSVIEYTIDGDIVARAVKDLMTDRAEWNGTAAELLGLLESLVDERAKKSHSWPANARALSGRLKRAAAFLRSAGVDITKRPRGRVMTIIRTKDLSVTSTSLS